MRVSPIFVVMRVSPIFVVSLLLTVFIWEHAARQHNSNQRPSVALNAVASTSISLFYWIGEEFAWMSSFLNWIDLGEFQKTAFILWQAFWNLFVSPLQAVKGYYIYMVSLEYSYAVILGSVLLVGLPLFGLFGWPKIPESRTRQNRVNELCLDR